MGRKETEARLKEEGADPCYFVRNKTVCKSCANKAMWNPYERLRQFLFFAVDHILFELLNIHLTGPMRWRYRWAFEYNYDPMIAHEDLNCNHCGQVIIGVKEDRTKGERWLNTSEICSMCGVVNDWQEGYFFNQPPYDSLPNAFLCKTCDDGLHIIRFAQDDFNADKPCRDCHSFNCQRKCKGNGCRNCSRECGCDCRD